MLKILYAFWSSFISLLWHLQSGLKWPIYFSITLLLFLSRFPLYHQIWNRSKIGHVSLFVAIENLLFNQGRDLFVLTQIALKFKDFSRNSKDLTNSRSGGNLCINDRMYIELLGPAVLWKSFGQKSLLILSIASRKITSMHSRHVLKTMYVYKTK